MDAADKEYVDTKLQAFVEKMNAEAAARHISTAAHFDELNTHIDNLEHSLREELKLKLAEFEIKLVRTQQELVKWIVGAMITGSALSLSATSVMLNYALPRPPAAVAAPATAPAPSTAQH